MANHSCAWYIDNNDLEGAYERFQETSANWKNRWWETVETIYTACADWAKRYILDPITHTLTKMKKRGRPAKHKTADLLTMECAVSGCGAYFVEHYHNGERVWGKCGKANNGEKRLLQHFTNDYPGEIDHGVVKLWYPCVNPDHALTMENVMRDYFNRKKGLTLLGNDRFGDYAGITPEDVAYLDKKYKITKKLFA